MGYEYLAFTEHNPSHSRHSEPEVWRFLRKTRSGSFAEPKTDSDKDGTI